MKTAPFEQRHLKMKRGESPALFRSRDFCFRQSVVVALMMVAVSFSVMQPLRAAEGNGNTAGQAKDPKAEALLQKVVDAYGRAASFSSKGEYNRKVDKGIDYGTFNILFSRPDEIRIDWTETQFDEEVTKGSIFTKRGDYFIYSGILNKYVVGKDMTELLGTGMGVSHDVSHAIPSLLRGTPSADLTLTTLKPPQDAVINGRQCVILSGSGNYDNTVEIAIDPNSFVILRLKITCVIRPSTMVKSEDFKKVFEEFKKSHTAARYATLLESYQRPDFTSVTVLDFKDPSFDGKLQPDDFVYPMPASAKKTDNIMIALINKVPAAKPQNKTSSKSSGH